ncbi:nitric oxide synthase oxygenase [Deinococcus multiflagellatus]|uniref:nitric oxide synthase oxygenase n=1 Tax=Deinococcus multiflagellatus TaxID=1656887 RepID=UPI001CCC189D|nr:nitric oxide synthase oxygenase [Deinococcus multiflagellatus]MBZ9713817.1 nitric oxide synthase oxygenase [Deinococcus multiflagellatus]
MPAPRLPDAAPPHELQEALAFLEAYHAETGAPGLAQRRQEVLRGGHLTLSSAELTHGARMAWRHSTRCVGRLPWASLQVRDLRQVTAAPEVFAHLCDHLRAALNGGRILPILSVFGPGVRLHNDQLIRYAGYRQPDGTVRGDPQNVALTGHLQRLGWAGGPGTPFDVLPLAIETQGQVTLFELPADAVYEVPITHPDCPGLGALGLRWHALPVISNMTLEVAGQAFACAPFNGWYLQTEIAARNLADEGRYNLLPAVAQALGLDTSRRRSLWLDRALVELNVAVLHSFDAAGVRIADHHSVTRQFQHFVELEAQAGRTATGRWSWLIPPLSPATTPVWHEQYDDTELKPNFVVQRPAWREQRSACPFLGK